MSKDNMLLDLDNVQNLDEIEREELPIKLIEIR